MNRSTPRFVFLFDGFASLHARILLSSCLTSTAGNNSCHVLALLSVTPCVLPSFSLISTTGSSFTLFCDTAVGSLPSSGVESIDVSLSLCAYVFLFLSFFPSFFLSFFSCSPSFPLGFPKVSPSFPQGVSFVSPVPW